MKVEGVIMLIGVETVDGRTVHDVKLPSRALIRIPASTPTQPSGVVGSFDAIWQVAGEVRALGTIDDSCAEWVTDGFPAAEVMTSSSSEGLPQGHLSGGELRSVILRLGPHIAAWREVWIEPIGESGSVLRACSQGFCYLGDRHEGSCIPAKMGVNAPF